MPIGNRIYVDSQLSEFLFDLSDCAFPLELIQEVAHKVLPSGRALCPTRGWWKSSFFEFVIEQHVLRASIC